MSAEGKVVPFSLKDAPALIERVWPAQKISVEAQRERKAGSGQILTATGSYWKGRKPLILVRACVLGSLLPSTDDSERDLAVFEKLMAIDDESFRHRVKKKGGWPAILDLPYLERVATARRPDELADDARESIWPGVNAHLGTCAYDLPSLVEQLGVMRFGHRPIVADTFAGGGSIPFEAGRIGCDVAASDLNPVACMLTWTAMNVIGAPPRAKPKIEEVLEKVALEVESEITRLGVESDREGNRAKAYLYCLEVRCPQTGWLVPVAPNWMISRSKRVVAKLVPDRVRKSFEIEVVSDAADGDLESAELGTFRSGQVVYTLDGQEYSTAISTIRGDYKKSDGSNGNRLRLWEKSDICPASGDAFSERLYCIQWCTAGTLERTHPETYFAAPTPDDYAREKQVEGLVKRELAAWQHLGFVPDTAIEPGSKTDEPIRTRGWTYWHHLFNPRQLLQIGLLGKAARSCTHPAWAFYKVANSANWLSRLCLWNTTAARPTGGPGDYSVHVFYNQALNTLYNYASRSWFDFLPVYRKTNVAAAPLADVQVSVKTCDARDIRHFADLFVTDPPYADAVMYDEITEFFIGWLRKNSPPEFADWLWDSRRSLAIKGEGESFRHRMVEAYAAMTNHMPDNGIQIVMFTHQSGEVWADMAQIFWGAGLQVKAAWYIATETTSELKKGGYVQGTVILVLRKRLSTEAGYRDEIVQEIKAEVANQIDTMVGLNQTLRGHGRIENLFEDADLQMAGYAAALRVLTAYARIDGTDMTREALRPRVKGEKNLVTDIIEFAVQVANEHLVPEGMDARVWERLAGSERFYCKMLDIETTGAKKLDNYQNFAKAFRVPDYAELMHSIKPNEARLKSAAQFKKAGFGDSEFGRSGTRAVLYALYELQAEVEGDLVLAHLRDLVDSYSSRRDDLAAIASYVALKRQDNVPAEAQAARILHGLIRNERLGA